MEVRDLCEPWYLIVGEPGAYEAEFKVYEIVSRKEDGTPYFRTGKCGPSETEDFSKAEVFASGFVKWDGCSNWNFDANEGVMMHGCRRTDLLDWGLVLAKCWDMAEDLVDYWNEDVVSRY